MINFWLHNCEHFRRLWTLHMHFEHLYMSTHLWTYCVFVNTLQSSSTLFVNTFSTCEHDSQTNVSCICFQHLWTHSTRPCEHFHHFWILLSICEHFPSLWTCSVQPSQHFPAFVNIFNICERFLPLWARSARPCEHLHNFWTLSTLVNMFRPTFATLFSICEHFQHLWTHSTRPCEHSVA